MSFWGCEITTSKPHSVEETKGDGEEEEKLLHVSNVTLVPAGKANAGNRYKVFAAVGDKKLVVASLIEGTLENYQLDLYFKAHEAPTFSVAGSGNASVHVTGYWEVSPDLMEDDYGMQPFEQEFDEEEEADLDPVVKGHIDQAKANALKNATAAFEDDDDEDDEEDDIPAPKQTKQAAQPAQKQAAKAQQQKAAKVEEFDEEDEEEEDESDMEGDMIEFKGQLAEESDDESDSDVPPQLVPAKGAQKATQKVAQKVAQAEDDDDEDDESDDIDVQKILAERKRKALNQDTKKDNNAQNKRQKTDEGKEKKAQQKGNDQKQGQNQQHNQKHNQNQQKHHQNKGQGQKQHQNQGGNKKRDQKWNKNKGGKKH